MTEETDTSENKSAKIVSLTGSYVPRGREVDPETIKLAEELLEKAQSGEIVGLITVSTYHDGTAEGDATGVVYCNTTVGCLERIKYGIIKDMEDELV